MSFETPHRTPGSHSATTPAGSRAFAISSAPARHVLPGTADKTPSARESIGACPFAESDAQLWQAGRFGDLRRKLLDDLIQADAIGDTAWLCDLSNNLACVYRSLGDLDSAAQFQRQAAIRDAEQAGAPVLTASTLSNLACDLMLAGDLATAESLFWKSLLEELAAGDAAAAGSDWANLALIAGLQGDQAECRGRFWEALKLHRRGHDQLSVAMDLWHLGQSFEITSDWSICRRLYARAEQLFTEIQNDAMRLEARKQKDFVAAHEAVVTFNPACN